MFDNPATDQAYDKLFNPPDIHEICNCEDCHLEDCHEDDILQWIKWGCLLCEEQFETLNAQENLAKKEG